MQNKTVLITGSADRIGAEIARSLHADDMDIIIHYHRSPAQAHSLVDALNAARQHSATSVQGNLLEDKELTGIIETAFAFRQRLDVLVNNASSFYPTPAGSTTTAQWEDLVGTNMKAPFFLSQQAARYLKEQHGCIINITDIYAERPLGKYPVYSAAKAGLTMLTRALARELAPEVRVNAIAPGAILWPEGMGDASKAGIISRTALGHAGEPADIARAVRFLIRDAGYMTGQVLTIDGGRSLYS